MRARPPTVGVTILSGLPDVPDTQNAAKPLQPAQCHAERAEAESAFFLLLRVLHVSACAVQMSGTYDH